MKARLAVAIVAAALAAGVPFPARAIQNSSCETAAKMTEAPPGTLLPIYPMTAFANDKITDAGSAWFTGVFHDVILSPDSPAWLYVYDWNAGCEKPKLECKAESAGYSAPARCAFNANPSRHYVEVRHTAQGTVSFTVQGVFHCVRYSPDDGCTS